MPASRRAFFSSLFHAVALAMATTPVTAQPRSTTIVASDPAAIRTWDISVDTMLRAGTLAVRRTEADTLVEGRTHVHLRQFHRGVPVIGAGLTRQTDRIGATVSIFGSTYADIDIDVSPALSSGDAAAIVQRQSGVELGPARMPSLCIIPTGSGFRLAYQARAFAEDRATLYLIDAQDGSILQESEALQQQSAVGSGTGVLGDSKKMSVTAESGAFNARDPLRPPLLTTYDMRENLARTLDFLNGRIPLAASDRATDADNVWTDGAAVDAHANTGFFYDYYFKRFGRRGLDDNNFRLLSLVHTVRRDAVLSQSSSTIGLFYLNAFYAGDGVMVYGEGLPASLTAGGKRWNYLSGALDVVAHELTHGITDFTSDLIYANESGALNESFSDMMGTAVEFFYQQAGSGPLSADYLIAEDVVTPGGIRSMENPAAYGQPDHYAKRIIVPIGSDNGGVHTNSGIPNHVYYLAIEGGTNRASGLTVQGVGQASREQIEKTMYRAFTQLMPAAATFAVARAATIQAATDLYGASSAAVRAITQAWTAVGVD